MDWLAPRGGVDDPAEDRQSRWRWFGFERTADELNYEAWRCWRPPCCFYLISAIFPPDEVPLGPRACRATSGSLHLFLLLMEGCTVNGWAAVYVEVIAAIALVSAGAPDCPSSAPVPQFHPGPGELAEEVGRGARAWRARRRGRGRGDGQELQSEKLPAGARAAPRRVTAPRFARIGAHGRATRPASSLSPSFRGDLADRS